MVKQNRSVAAPIFMVSAIASGQGKTSVTASLAARLRSMGQKVRVFKTGADFIDPMVLEQATGDAVESLDLWLLGKETCQSLLHRAAHEVDVVLVEGVMGLYDGTPSSADLAKAFGIPVLLVIDAAAMAQTIGAIAMGMRDFGGVNLAGVIANRVASEGHAQFLRDALVDIPLLAYLPPQKAVIPERHLGLVLPQEQSGLSDLMQQLGQSLVLDMQVWAAACDVACKVASYRVIADETGNADLPQVHTQISTSEEIPTEALRGKTIAIARDAAFAFLYPANLSCLQQLGAQVIYFSPLANEAVPKEVDAVYLPGGYPELHAEVLSHAHVWQASIRRAHSRGLVIYAECGGMMSLASQLIDQNGKTWPMAGLLNGRIQMHPRLQALGMQYLETTHGVLRGHSFHFSSFDTRLTPSFYAVRKGREDQEITTASAIPLPQGEAVYQLHGLVASYFHAYFPSNPAAVAALFLGGI